MRTIKKMALATLTAAAIFLIAVNLIGLAAHSFTNPVAKTEAGVWTHKCGVYVFASTSGVVAENYSGDTRNITFYSAGEADVVVAIPPRVRMDIKKEILQYEGFEIETPYIVKMLLPLPSETEKKVPSAPFRIM